MTLRHSLFDKIFISFLVIFTVCFGFIVLYASNVTRSMLVDDRTEVLTNEAFLIADQTVAGYVPFTPKMNCKKVYAITVTN